MMTFRPFGVATLLFSTLLAGRPALAQTEQTGSEAAAIAATVMTTWKDSGDAKTPRWTYDESLVWKGLEGCWYNTGNARYFKYIQHLVDRLVDKEGNIATYKQDDYNLDNVLGGRILLLLYKVTNQEKYYKAATILRQQLRDQPRTAEGSFWHKKKYTRQVWLDGLYMAQPFYAEYASLFHEDTAFNDITRQFAAIERQWAGMEWPWWMRWIISRRDIPAGPCCWPSSNVMPRRYKKCRTPLRASGGISWTNPAPPVTIPSPPPAVCSYIPWQKEFVWATCPPPIWRLQKKDMKLFSGNF